LSDCFLFAGGLELALSLRRHLMPRYLAPPGGPPCQPCTLTSRAHPGPAAVLWNHWPRVRRRSCGVPPEFLPPGEGPSNFFVTAQACHLPPPEVGPQPNHAIFAPKYPFIYVLGVVGPFSPFHTPNVPSCPLEVVPRSGQAILARANFPSGVFWVDKGGKRS